MKTFYAIKSNQTHAYDKRGKRLLVTRLLANPLVVTQVKTSDKDGYEGIQVGLGNKERQTLPIKGHLKASESKSRILKEIRLEEVSTKQVKEMVIASDVLAVGDKVSVHAKSKGRGFSGVVKRWNFAGGPKTHGQSDRTRAPGSIGQGTTPGRVLRGKKMAGHLGNSIAAVAGGKIINIDEDNQELWISGTVPGKPGEVVKIKKLKSGNFVGLWETEKATKPVQVEESQVSEEAKPVEDKES